MFDLFMNHFCGGNKKIKNLQVFWLCQEKNCARHRRSWRLRVMQRLQPLNKSMESCSTWIMHGQVLVKSTTSSNSFFLIFGDIFGYNINRNAAIRLKILHNKNKCIIFTSNILFWMTDVDKTLRMMPFIRHQQPQSDVVTWVHIQRRSLSTIH